MRYKFKETIMLLLNELEESDYYCLNNLETIITNKDMMDLLVKNNFSTKVFDLIREYKIIQSRLKILKIKVEEDKYEVEKIMEVFNDLQKNHDSVSFQWQKLNRLVKEIKT